MAPGKFCTNPWIMSAGVCLGPKLKKDPKFKGSSGLNCGLFNPFWSKFFLSPLKKLICCPATDETTRAVEKRRLNWVDSLLDHSSFLPKTARQGMETSRDMMIFSNDPEISASWCYNLSTVSRRQTWSRVDMVRVMSSFSCNKRYIRYHLRIICERRIM